MGYCGECQYWSGQHAPDEKDCIGICEISKGTVNNLRHSCIMFSAKQSLVVSSLGAVEKYKIRNMRKKA